MIPKHQRGNYRGGYRPQILVDQNKVVLPDEVISKMDNLDDVVFMYASNLAPKPVHEYSEDLNKSLDQVVGNWIWVIQNGDPFLVKIMQPRLPKLVKNVTQFKLKNLGGYYYKPQRKYYYKADSLVLVAPNDH